MTRLRLCGLLLLGLWGCSDPSDSITVMTYNIRHCVGLDGSLDLERIARVIKQSDPDILILNEVDQGTQRVQGIQQAESLSQLLEMDYRFGRSIDYDGGEYGNALLTKFPISSFQVKDVSYDSTLEGRSVFLSELLIGADTLLVMGTHLGLSAAERVYQVDRILSDLPANSRVVFAGDMNFEPSSEEYSLVSAVLADAIRDLGVAGPTFPADVPDRRIDYIFSGAGINPTKVSRADHPEVGIASDHLPQTLDFTLKH